jgi:catechol 2,3-dioxygenase-like lactoylglutathione lyase family enzyme
MAPSFNLIGLVVADMGKSLAFYRRLGLDIPVTADAEPHVHVALPSGQLIAWDNVETVRSFDPSWSPPSGSARVGLAFACADPAEVDQVYADLVQAGYDGHLRPWDAFWGQRYAAVYDPDGNSVELYAPLPGTPATS